MLYNAIETPFDSQKTEGDISELETILMMVGYLFISGSEPIANPAVIYTTVFETLAVLSNATSTIPGNNITGLDDINAQEIFDVIQVDFSSNVFGHMFINWVYVSKIIALIAAVMTTTKIVVFPDFKAIRLKETIIGRSIIGASFAFSSWVYVFDFMGDLERRYNGIEYIQELRRQNIISQNENIINGVIGIIVDNEIAILLTDFVYVLLSLVVVYLLLFHKNFKVALLPLFTITLKCMELLDNQGVDDYRFNILFLTSIIQVTSVIVITILAIILDIDTIIIRQVSGLLYRVGHIVTIIALLFLLVSVKLFAFGH